MNDAITTEERRAALIRLRKRRSKLIHEKSGWRVAISDTLILIDALERLITLDIKENR